MNGNALPWKRLISTRLLPLLVTVTLSVCGCAHQPMIANAPAQYLWQSGDQFVALVPAEQLPATVSNDHPVTLDRDRLRGALATLEWQEPGEAKPVQLLTDYELSILAEQLKAGLARSTAGEELVFALIGNHPALMGLARSPMATTGRVFFSKGRLNIIMGKVHEAVGKNDDRRLDPFLPGSRGNLPRLSGQLLVPQAVGGKRRADWLVIDPNASVPQPVSSQGGAGREPVSAEQAVQPRKQADRPKSVEERLILLNGLKEKGLITEQEYRTKRQEILGDI